MATDELPCRSVFCIAVALNLGEKKRDAVKVKRVGNLDTLAAARLGIAGQPNTRTGFFCAFLILVRNCACNAYA
jgi:hypothetical protein